MRSQASKKTPRMSSVQIAVGVSVEETRSAVSDTLTGLVYDVVQPRVSGREGSFRDQRERSQLKAGREIFGRGSDDKIETSIAGVGGLLFAVAPLNSLKRYQGCSLLARAQKERKARRRAILWLWLFQGARHIAGPDVPVVRGPVFIGSSRRDDSACHGSRPRDGRRACAW